MNSQETNVASCNTIWAQIDPEMHSRGTLYLVVVGGGVMGGPWGGLEEVLGDLGRSWGGLGGLLGGSWGGLGRSWGGPGRSWEDLGATL